MVTAIKTKRNTFNVQDFIKHCSKEFTNNVFFNLFIQSTWCTTGLINYNLYAYKEINGLPWL